MTGFLRLLLAVYLGGLLLGISGVAIWAAMYTKPTSETTWPGRALWWAGHAVVAVGLAAVAGLIVAAVVVGALHILH